jgi:hypothetical protein
MCRDSAVETIRQGGTVKSTTLLVLAGVGVLAIVAAWVFLGGDGPAGDVAPASGSGQAAEATTAGGNSNRGELPAGSPLDRSIEVLRQEYHLATASRLQWLSRTADDAARLSDEQRERLAAVNESVVRMADEAFREIRAAQEELRRQAEAAERTAAADPERVRQLKQELWALVQRQQEITNEMDRRYTDLVSKELTPEQMRVLLAAPRPQGDSELPATPPVRLSAEPAEPAADSRE